MPTNVPSPPHKRPYIQLSALLRTVAAPLIVWGMMVISLTTIGQPGVVCMTPVAWVLAFWSGGQYIRLTRDHPDRQPLLGAALVGAVLGLCLSGLFFLVASLAMPVGPEPGEMIKMLILSTVLGVGGVAACTLFSLFTAWLTLNRIRREESREPVSNE